MPRDRVILIHTPEKEEKKHRKQQRENKAQIAERIVRALAGSRD